MSVEEEESRPSYDGKEDSSLTCRQRGSAYSDLYKNVGKMTDSQSQRRHIFLADQKEKRQNAVDERRNFSYLFDETEEEESELMEVDKKHKNNHRLRFKLMMSEWFTEIPEDLADNWIVKFCPDGKRRLVIAQKNTTRCFTKMGYYTFRFMSNLPGSGNMYTRKDCITVLDCVYQNSTKTFYILDLLVWNSVSFMNCEGHLRHYWLKSKFEESPEILRPYKNSPYHLKLLDWLPADSIQIKSRLFECKDMLYDGLIFYHKEAIYIEGSTPLVTWLKPYMLPEKLNIDVPQVYLSKQPKQYINLERFLQLKVSRNKTEMANKIEIREENGMDTETVLS